MAQTGSGPGGHGSSPDLNAPSESLQEFKKRVDKLLTELDSSDAAHSRISHQTVAGSAYGNGFAEATSLARAYDTVHGELQRLSKLLGEQLEGMGIAVSLADKTYQDIDHDQARRLQQIQKHAAAYYEQYQKEHGQNDQTVGDTGTGTSGGSTGL
ncbi:hypothetical protein RKE29_16325 [Streptomyces sp. B1866]|uniref:hypothetical protein n=1 Tax=Streptomyces sp. B1866 TaxID=3075431 RepID=UPI0028912EE1|nr:hypothetical protein [Streptomyces sp. B1866]MDT3398189.1 hypothetical protein [Streptomyces sp. B1866]